MAFPFIYPIPGVEVVAGIYALVAEPKQKYAGIEHTGYKPSVSVVIPARNEEKRLPFAIASLDNQTYPIEKVFVVDGGSTDRTYEVAKTMKGLANMNIEPIRDDTLISKTEKVKKIAKESDSDKLLVLDADTILISRDYIEKLVAPHADESVATTYGIAKPMTKKGLYSFKCNNDKIAEYQKNLDEKNFNYLKVVNFNPKTEHEKKFMANILNSKPDTILKKGLEDAKTLLSSLFDSNKKDLNYGIKGFFTKRSVEKYREAVYIAEQNFMRDVQQRLTGTTLFPVGAGVLYDRKKLVDVLDYYEPIYGDNLTVSEDIFFGFAFCDRGLKNIQVGDVQMISDDPVINKLPRQLYLWSSAFIQNAYYFPNISKSFIRGKKGKNGERNPNSKTGWFVVPPILEMLTYPAALGAVAYLYDPYTALMVLGVEFGIYSALTMASAKKEERKELITDIPVSGLVRLIAIPVGLYCEGKFLWDVARGKREWRK
jgi:glycosyltransferase involved in cell wall biosynthesis